MEQASRAPRSLLPLSECADIAALRAPTPRPRDAETSAKIDALGERLALVEANYAVGKASEAAKLGDAVLEDAQKVGFGPLLAQVHLWRGRAYADVGDSSKSIPAFRDAFAAALGAREEYVLRVSASRLAQEYVYDDKPDEYEYWARVADEAIRAAGPTPRPRRSSRTSAASRCGRRARCSRASRASRSTPRTPSARALSTTGSS